MYSRQDTSPSPYPLALAGTVPIVAGIVFDLEALIFVGGGIAFVAAFVLLLLARLSGRTSFAIAAVMSLAISVAAIALQVVVS